MPNLVNEIIREDLRTITQSSAEDLRKIVNSHVVLIGASGFIGTWLTLSYLDARRELKGNGTIVLSCRNTQPLQDLLTQAGFHEGFEFVEADVRNFPVDIIRDQTLLVNAATPARASLNNENPLEMFDIIEQGQRRLLDLCSEKKSVRFLFLSSGAVYGSQPQDLIGLPETWTGAPDVTNPANAYHEGKRIAELMGFMFSKTYSFEFISARLFAFLAPFLPLDEHFAAGNFLRDAINSQSIRITSGGGSVRSYQYATDLCSNLWALLMRGKNGEAYNVGSDDEISVKRLAELIVEVVNPDLDVDVTGIDTYENLSRYVPSLEKLKATINQKRTVEITEAVQRTFLWAISATGQP